MATAFPESVRGTASRAPARPKKVDRFFGPLCRSPAAGKHEGAGYGPDRPGRKADGEAEGGLGNLSVRPAGLPVASGGLNFSRNTPQPGRQAVQTGEAASQAL